MGNDRTWVLVADAGRARIFAVDPATAALDRTPLHDLTTETAPSRDIASDRPGRTFQSAGVGRSAKEPPTDPHRYRKQRFASDLAELLASERGRGAFDRLVVVAPPQLLGDLRADYTPELRAVVISEVAKDLAMFAPHELDERLADVLRG